MIDFSMYLKNDIDDYRSEERYDLSVVPMPHFTLGILASPKSNAVLCFMSVSMVTEIAR